MSRIIITSSLGNSFDIKIESFRQLTPNKLLNKLISAGYIKAQSFCILYCSLDENSEQIPAAKYNTPLTKLGFHDGSVLFLRVKLDKKSVTFTISIHQEHSFGNSTSYLTPSHEFKRKHSLKRLLAFKKYYSDTGFVEDRLPLGALIIRAFNSFSKLIIGAFNSFSKVILHSLRRWAHKKDPVFSSVFCPAEIGYKSHMLVQVYLHLWEETDLVQSLARESQKETERRVFIPLQCHLKHGDKVDILLNINGESLLHSEKKSIIWQGSFTKCSFAYFVPGDIKVKELNCKTVLTVNEIPIGEMQFITKIVRKPRYQVAEVINRNYRKIFISYAHLDEDRVNFLARGLKVAGIDHFFDREYLKAGDIYPEKIRDYINSADLFILCWSKNAAASDYVTKERTQALSLAYPQKKENATLSMYPIRCSPHAELPDDMKGNYHFETISNNLPPS